MDNLSPGAISLTTLTQGHPAAVAELRELRRDAARYRWLRQERGDTSAPWIGVLHHAVSRLCDNVADAAVDAAMRDAP